jgi:hypothetical protein
MDIDTEFLAVRLVLDVIIAQLEKYVPVFLINPEFLSKKQFSLGIEINEHFIKIVNDFIVP